MAAVLALSCGSGGEPAGPEDGRPPAITLPVRVHVLESRLTPIAGTLSDAELGSLLSRVNEVWAPARIVWRLESIVREPALAEDELEEAFAGLAPITADLLASAFPRDRFSGGWDVFIVRDLTPAGVPGVYFPTIPMVVSSEIDPSGLGDPGRILAHELGHSLTLLHVPCTTAGNLMSPGCPAADRTRLAPDQIEQARAQATLGVPSGI